MNARVQGAGRSSRGALRAERRVRLNVTGTVETGKSAAACASKARRAAACAGCAGF
ncbi:MAG: hypothetical protein ACLUI3_10125 [Christensenellales bacterium]